MVENGEGRHSIAVAFALRAQLAQVRFSAFTKIFSGNYLMLTRSIGSSALLREIGQCLKGLRDDRTDLGPNSYKRFFSVN